MRNISLACFISEVESSDAPGAPFRQRDHYTHIALDVYALHETKCDSSDLSYLSQHHEEGKTSIVGQITSEMRLPYTHILRCSNGDLYAVCFED